MSLDPQMFPAIDFAVQENYRLQDILIDASVPEWFQLLSAESRFPACWTSAEHDNLLWMLLNKRNRWSRFNGDKVGGRFERSCERLRWLFQKEFFGRVEGNPNISRKIPIAQ